MDEKQIALFKALIEFKKLVRVVGFDAQGQKGAGKFGYTTLAGLIYQISPALSECELGFFQTFSESGSFDTTIFHASGGTLVSKNKIIIPKYNEVFDKPGRYSEFQQLLGAIETYYKRRDLATILGIGVAGDPDIDSLPPADYAPQEEVKKEISKSAWQSGLEKTKEKIKKSGVDNVIGFYESKGYKLSVEQICEMKNFSEGIKNV